MRNGAKEAVKTNTVVYSIFLKYSKSLYVGKKIPMQMVLQLLTVKGICSVTLRRNKI